MKNEELEKLTDEQLAGVYAIECAGLECLRWGHPVGKHGTQEPQWCKCEPDHEDAKWFKREYLVEQIPPFATSADELLPHLGQFKAYNWHVDAEERELLDGGFCVSLVNGVTAYAPTFARAACMALIMDARYSATRAAAEAKEGT